MSVVATLLVRVAANLTELDKTFSELERSADRISKAYSKLGGQLQGIGSKLTTSLTLPLAGIGAAAAKSYMDFDSAMRGVQAAIQPTKAQLDELEHAAMEWGAKTQYSATEAAQALGELGKAGIDSANSVKLLPSVLNLATVGEMALADAAGLTTDTLTQFGLKAEDAGHVNDVLAKSAQVSTTSVAELGNALRYAGPVAGAFGMSIDETGAALAMFANAGFKADMAGTALRGVISEVKNPAKGLRDVLAELHLTTLASADGTVHLVDVMRKLEGAGADSAQLLKAFGDRAGPALVAAMQQGSGALEKMNETMQKSDGTAKAVADTLMSGFGGAVEQMRGAVETAGISIGKVLAPALETAANWVGKLAEWVSGTLVPAFQALPKSVQVAAGAFAGIVAGIGPAVYIGGELVQSFGAMAGLFGKTAGGAAQLAEGSATLTKALTLESIAAWASTAATGAFEAVVAVLLHPVTLVVAAVAGLVIGLRYLTGSWEGVLQVLTLGLVNFKTLAAIWDGLKGAASLLAQGFNIIAQAVQGFISEAGGKLSPLMTTLKNLFTEFATWLAGNAVAAFNAIRNAVATFADSGIGKLLYALGELWIKLQIGSVLLVAKVALEALGLAVRGVQLFIADFVNDLKGAWNSAWKMATDGVNNTILVLKVAAAWFGVDLPKAIQAVIEKLSAMAGGIDTWARNVAAGIGVVIAILPGMSGAASAMERATLNAAAASTNLAANNDVLAAGNARVKETLDAAAAAAVKHEAAAKANAETSKAAAAAAKRAAEEYQKLADAMSGKDTLDKAKQLTAVLADLTAKGMKPSAEGAKQVREALEAAAEVFISTGKKVPPEMGRLWASLLPPTKVENDLRQFAGLFTRSMAPVIPSVRQLVGQVNTTLAGIHWEAFVPSPADRTLLARELANWGKDLKGQIDGIFTGMFTGQTGFRDGLSQMFHGVQGFANGLIGDFQREFSTQMTNVFKGGDFDFKELFGGAKSKTAGAAAGAAVGLTVGMAFGKAFGKEVGAITGAASGAAMGAVYGGWVGAGVGAGVGFVSGWMAGVEKEAAQKQAMQGARGNLLEAFGGMEQLAKTVRSVGVDFDALWTSNDPKVFNEQLNQFQTNLASSKAAMTQLAKSMDDASKAGALLSLQDFSGIADMVAKGFPGASDAAAAFIGAQQDAATKGIDAFLTNAQIKTERGALAISASLAGIYQTMIEGGASPTQAFAAMEGTIAKLQAQLDKTGMAGAAAFTPLADLARLAADSIAGPVFDAMAGLEQGLTSTANLGLLNQETFSGFADELLASYKGLEAQGKGGTVAMAGMQGALQKAWEISEQFGYSLEGGQKELIDYALQAGLIGEKFKPATDRMVDAINGLIDRMDKFLLKFNEIDPNSKAAVNSLNENFGKIKQPVIKPTIELPEPPDFSDPRWRYASGGAAGGPSAGGTLYVPAMASGGIVTKPTVALIGERGPEAVVPLSSDFMGADLTVYLDSEVITRAVLRKQPRQLRAYGAVR